MPDLFDTICADGNKNITIVCGDSFTKSYTVENALEVVLQSPSFSYQVPLVQDETDPTLWVLSFTSQQTEIIDAGSYEHQIKVKYTDESIKTVETGWITFLPSIFPLYKTYPVVLREVDPTSADNQYGLTTLWYNKTNKSLWALQSVLNQEAVWEKTSSLLYIYQTAITEDFKFQGDTTIFTFFRVIDGNIVFIPGSYDEITKKTSYTIDLTGITTADYYLYIDKTIEDKEVLGDFDTEISEELIIYRYIYIKDSLEKVATLESNLTNYRETLSQAQLDTITALINQMITEAQFPSS